MSGDMLAVGLLGLLVFLALIGAAVYAVVTYTHTRDIHLRDVSADGREQYVARTPAGRAVITKVFDDRGWAYEIETYFDGQVALFYVAPAMRAAKDRLAVLVENHLAQRAQRQPQRRTPRKDARP